MSANGDQHETGAIVTELKALLDLFENDGKVDQASPLMQQGGAFLFDDPTDIQIRWGDEEDVMWATGESLIIAGPSGAGKTTVTGQLLEALVGIRDEVLGFPVTPSNRVLYLAMDRPSQVRRAFRRLFRERDRPLLDERFWVHKGPVLADIRKNPTYIKALAKEYLCDLVIIDSLKDLLPDISDTKAGQEGNIAIQHCLAANIDVLILHHLRKVDVKPTSLNDLMGSSMIANGAGSVILLWGSAGAESVELTMLKPVQEIVGPWTIEHDHHEGRSRIVKGFNLLQYVRGRKEYGTTVLEAAKAQFGEQVKTNSSGYKKAQRALNRLVDRGSVVRDQTASDMGSRGGGFRFRAIDPVDTLGTVDTYRGHEQ